MYAGRRNATLRTDCKGIRMKSNKRFEMVAVLAMLTLGMLTAGVNTWTSIGPEGGSVWAVAIDPQNSRTLYGMTGAGLFKSTDGGASWSAAKPGLPASVSASSLVIDPQNSGTMYAVTDVDVFKSTDGGANWSALKAELPMPTNQFYASDTVVIDPQDSNTLYASTRTGVFKSVDGGASWNAVNIGLPGPKATSSLAIDPNQPGTLYAGISGGGLFKSTDGGARWSDRLTIS